MNAAINNPLEASTKSVLPGVASDLCRKRREAIDARKASGIESRWEYAENAYEGEDEATIAEGGVYKPQTLNGPFITIRGEDRSTRSTAVPNITRPYVDSASAHVCDILFPTDEENYDIRLTPQTENQALFELIAETDPEAALEGLQMELQQAASALERGKGRIADLLKECNWTAVGREAIEDACRVGTGVIKGPVPMPIDGKTQAGTKVIDVKNLYPAPDCGCNIHDGEYLFEKEEVSARWLRKRVTMESSGWLPNEVLAVLAEGPKNLVTPSSSRPTKLYELWYYQGEIPVAALEEVGWNDIPDSSPRVWANITLCNERIVRMSMAPLSDVFTYQLMRWQRRKNHWAGIGVGEQMEVPQRGLTAAIRNLFDNAALSALPQIIFWKGIVEPVDGRFELVAGKIWQVTSDGTVTLQDVEKALTTIEIPTRQAELMEIAALMRTLAQEMTGLPLILLGQGSSGAVGTDQMQTNAANASLRRIAKNFDNDVTIPHISSYYRWLREIEQLQLPEASIDARGSSVLVERDIQAQALIQMVQLSKDPTYGFDPKLVAAEWAKSQKFDPRKIALSPEREKELWSLLSQPDEKAEATVKSAELRATALDRESERETQADFRKMELEFAEAERQREHEIVLSDRQFEQDILKYAVERDIDVRVALKELEDAKREAKSKSKSDRKE